MHGREIDCVVEKDDIVEHYGDANMLILAVVCREGGSRGLFRLAVPTPCHSCSSSDCYPSYQALTYYCGWTVLVGLQSFAGEEHYGESLQARLVI
jgi:hypothetical protein